MGRSTREYFPSLEGIRGYAFLLVFLIHYTESFQRPTNLALYPFFILQNTAWFLVPIFFVLSGFLITRILWGTREREGYFRIFYLRRIVRIFPLYYLTMIPLGLFALLRHWPVHPHHLLYLVYLQNFWQFSQKANDFNHYVTLVHLWSLAIEEQFYLVWPLILWLVPSEKVLLRVSYGIIALCCLVRIAYPLSHLPYEGAYFYTVTRVDAIIMGSVLAFYHKRAVTWGRLIKLSRVLIPAIWGTLIVLTLIRGTGLTEDYLGVALFIPCMNVIGAGFVILALNPAGLINRICSGNLICRIGRLTYSLYLFHAIYARIFTQLFVGRLDRYMPHILSETLMIAAAFALTMALALLAYRFIELPAMRWKNRFGYGPRTPREDPTVEVGEHVLGPII